MARVCVVFLLAGTVWIGAAPAQQSEGERRILTNGRPLVEQLRPTDRRVVLPINSGPYHFGTPPEGVSLERFMLDQCPLVAVLRVLSVRHKLVHRDDMDIDAIIASGSTAAGDVSRRNVPASEDGANWIIASIRARVEGFVKPASVLKEGQELLFEEDGGTAMVRGVEVVATVPWHRPMMSGKRYLVFGSLTEEGKLLRTAVYEEPSPFAVLVGIGPQRAGDQLETFSVQQALFHLGQEMSTQ
jgi:hypothetical protein